MKDRPSKLAPIDTCPQAGESGTGATFLQTAPLQKKIKMYLLPTMLTRQISNPT